MEKICAKCNINKDLSKFHIKCKNKNIYQSWCKDCVYTAQKLRWKDRKRKIVGLCGGKCSKCNYNKCISSLDLHHLDPSTKEYDWDSLRSLKWETILKEVNKCILVCKNCHGEIHSSEENFDLISSGKDNVLLNTQLSTSLINTGSCSNCFKPVYGTKYCSKICARFSSRKVIRPSKEEILKLQETMTMVDIGKKYGVSDNSIRKWLK